MVCVRVDSEVVVKFAWPVASSATPPERFVAPSRNVTVPVGVPDPGACAVTAAVNVTAPPCTDGLGDAVTVVVVASGSTRCANGLDDDSPRYWLVPVTG